MTYVGILIKAVTILFNCTTKYRRLNSSQKRVIKKDKIVIFTIIFIFCFMILNIICIKMVVICYGQVSWVVLKVGYSMFCVEIPEPNLLALSLK